MGQVGRGDARARVGDGDENVGIAASSAHGDAAALRRVAHGVLQEVREHLREVVRLGARPDHGGKLELDAESPPLERGGVQLDGRDDGRAEIDLAKLARAARGDVAFGERIDRARQPDHAIHLLVQRFEGRAVRRHDPVSQGLEIALKGRQWRAQLVGRV